MAATHVAIPATYRLGPVDSLKRIGTCMWAVEGPRARRRLAAIDRVLTSDYMPLPVGWDSVARSLDFQAPDPLTRPVFRGASQPIPTIA